ncbi:MAG: 2-amino-4-hydroxy-6-hydroxymethyldihydropteridine diphosphokinase [Omnitrophica WOR_2 bacterium RBG_13_44_8b]|nr:MAG: 2-amino-4-hydroxy-6-hydroxymethyldihydropteridine diphosphokinase [Omnitrophica WOR_2 bacterium RBG_13_44_8b]
MVTCYIGIGSNLGDRRKNITLAIDKINQLQDSRVTKISSIIETEPQGGPLQGKFLNACLEVQTELAARELLKNLQNIESELGRVRTVKYGPRTIDLDILLFNNEEIKDEDLTVPHPKMLEREFVLTPLKEIAPAQVLNLLNADNQKN